MQSRTFILSAILILIGMHGTSVCAGEIFWITDQTGWSGIKIPVRSFSSNENQLTDSDKRSYIEWRKKGVGGKDSALAQSPRGWAAGFGESISSAKRAAVKNCNRHIRSKNCEIVDVNGQSAYINQRNSQPQSTTASTSTQKRLSNVLMSDRDKQKYLTWIKKEPTLAAALALDKNGCWQAAHGRGTGPAKRAALEKCAWKCKSNSCRIVDLNGTSEFITRKDEERAKRQAEIKLREQLKKRKEVEAEKRRKEKKRKLQEERRKELEKRKRYVLEHYKTISLSELVDFLRSDSSSASLINNYFYRSLVDEIKNGFDPYEAVVKVIQSASNSGISLSNLTKTPVRLFFINQQEDAKHAGNEFPVSVTGSTLPELLQPKKVSIEDLTKLSLSDKDIALLIFNISETKVIREVSKHEKIQSEYQVSTQELPNPAYELARIDVEDKAELVREGRIRQRQCSLTCYGIGCFACLAWVNKISALTKRYESAKQRLSNTPMTISKPIYQPYNFNRNTISIQKIAHLELFVFDHDLKAMLKKESVLEESRGFRINYRMHEKDKNAYKHRQGVTTDEEATQFEDKAVTVTYDDLVTQSSIKESQTHLSSIDDLSNRIRLQRAKQENKELVIVNSKDSRKSKTLFDSVVIVFHPDGGIGSGFYINEDTVLTNYHVISGTSYVEIGLYDETESFGKVIGQDIRLDLALIRVQKRGTPLSIYKGNPLQPGATVDAIGHPQGLEYSLTRGTVSSVRQLPSLHDPGGRPVWLVQSDVAINPGNSGGPLLYNNQVIGVNVQKLAAMELEGLSFAVHYLEVHRFLEKNGL